MILNTVTDVCVESETSFSGKVIYNHYLANFDCRNPSRKSFPIKIFYYIQKNDVTPIEYKNCIRIKNTEKMLLMTNLSIEAIAENLVLILHRILGGHLKILQASLQENIRTLCKQTSKHKCTQKIFKKNIIFTF